jgi:peptidyl-prolyl cis-trans isomerase A (cyclophilin A)
MYPTRRRALRAGATLAAAALTGCASSPPATPTPSSPSQSAGTPTSTDGGGDDGESAPGADRPNALPSARRATLRTTKGDIAVELYPGKVPTTVGNFVGLATGEVAWRDPETGDIRTDPLYRNVPFHRVINNFMIQCGDPIGTGRGGPGYTFDDEFRDDLTHDRAGVLSMANRGPDTNGSQFFITLDATPHLDGRHAVFGHVVGGMDVVRAIGSVVTDGNDRPRGPVLLESVAVADEAMG